MATILDSTYRNYNQWIREILEKLDEEGFSEYLTADPPECPVEPELPEVDDTLTDAKFLDLKLKHYNIILAHEQKEKTYKEFKKESIKARALVMKRMDRSLKDNLTKDNSNIGFKELMTKISTAAEAQQGVQHIADQFNIYQRKHYLNNRFSFANLSHWSSEYLEMSNFIADHKLTAQHVLFFFHINDMARFREMQNFRANRLQCSLSSLDPFQINKDISTEFNQQFNNNQQQPMEAMCGPVDQELSATNKHLNSDDDIQSHAFAVKAYQHSSQGRTGQNNSHYNRRNRNNNRNARNNYNANSNNYHSNSSSMNLEQQMQEIADKQELLQKQLQNMNAKSSAKATSTAKMPNIQA